MVQTRDKSMSKISGRNSGDDKDRDRSDAMNNIGFARKILLVRTEENATKAWPSPSGRERICEARSEGVIFSA